MIDRIHTPPSHRRRARATRLATAGLLAASAASIPSSAHAGAYWVSACGAEGVNQAIVAGIPVASSLGAGVESSMNCNDKGWGGHNAMQIHVREFADGQPGPQFIGFNESANMFINAPGGAFLEGVYTEASRLATSYPNATGFGARVMAVNRSWCRLQGTGGTNCPESSDGADNSQNIPWHQGNYPSRGNRWYGTGNGTGTTSLAFGVVCDGGSSAAGGQCYRTRSGSSAGVALTSANIKVRDDQAPTISAVSGGITGGNWRKPGPQNFKVTGWDNTGISKFETYVDGQPFHTFYQGCDYTKMKPCEDRTLEADAVVGTNFDGLHDFTVRAVSANTDEIACAYDCADSYVASIWTDGTAPGSAVTANNNGGWRNVNSFQLSSQTPASENDPDGSGPRHNSPITGRVVTTCPSVARNEGEAGCVTKNQSTGDPSAAPGQGAWWTVVRLVDEAGNVGASSNRVPIQYDATAPTVAVDQAREAVSVAARDALSGVASTRYRTDGAGAWKVQPATAGDFKVPFTPGQHYIELQVTDNAGNQSQIARFDFLVPDGDGNATKPVPLVGPGSPGGTNGDPQLRVEDRGAVNGVNATEAGTVTAWFVKASKRKPLDKSAPKKTKSKTKGKRAIAAPKKVKPNPSVITIGEKDSASIQGLLVNSQGTGIGNARIDLYAKIAGGRIAVTRAAAQTDAEGNFTIPLKPGQTSKRLTVGYAARINDPQPTAAAGLELVVKARASFTAHRPPRGRLWTFTGFVSSGYLTKQGVEVRVQYWSTITKDWEEFDTVSTDQKGRWKTTRRFTAPATYRMRAFVKSTPAYAYKGATSRVRTVRVR